MKLAEALDTDILALSDSDAGITREAESKYVLNLMENAVFGGIPIERTVMSPVKEQMVSPELIAFRGPLLKRFNKAVERGRAGLESPAYEPVRILYSAESVMFSREAQEAIVGAEEILLRHHIPFGLLPADTKQPLKIPEDCEVLLVANQTCLSGRQLAALVRYANGGGRLVVTGNTGDYDEHYRERRENPLAVLDSRSGVVRREEIDNVSVRGCGWTIKVAAPNENDPKLVSDIESLWKPVIRVEAPETVFTEIKRGADGFTIHFLNYASGTVPEGSRIILHGVAADSVQCRFDTPMEDQERRAISVAADAEGQTCSLPEFADYAVVDLLVK